MLAWYTCLQINNNMARFQFFFLITMKQYLWGDKTCKQRVLPLPSASFSGLSSEVSSLLVWTTTLCVFYHFICNQEAYSLTKSRFLRLNIPCLLPSFDLLFQTLCRWLWNLTVYFFILQTLSPIYFQEWNCFYSLIIHLYHAKTISIRHQYKCFGGKYYFF